MKKLIDIYLYYTRRAVSPFQKAAVVIVYIWVQPTTADNV